MTTSPYGSHTSPGKVRISHLAGWKRDNTRWAMLTSYDMLSASIFEEAGIPVFLVGDSAANNVLGYDTTLGVGVDEMIMLTRAVTRAVRRPLVVADLPFGTYHESPAQALATATRFMKEAGAHAVKLEGGEHMAPTVAKLTSSGIPVMAHIGFTPQSEHTLGGYKVQGRDDAGAAVLEDALALQDAGAFSVVMEMVPAPLAAKITTALDIPTIGIGAGPDCDAQVLVWQDMMGMRAGRMPRFVKQYADMRTEMLRAAEQFASDVLHGRFPTASHSFLD